MNFTVAYKGHSGLTNGSLSFAPNLRRDRVSFCGDLLDPLRFREAVECVTRCRRQRSEVQAEGPHRLPGLSPANAAARGAIRQLAFKQAKEKLLAEPERAIPTRLEKRFQSMREKYWSARLKYADFLARNDPALFRVLVPCDPVVTVAPDVLFFECFSKDESSYGCLTADRDLFATPDAVAPGTTNVDYSLPLYDEFQRLRTYRRTRFAVDPSGFEVKTEGAADYREEKIDLPPSWLRGFMQLQAAMSCRSLACR